MSTKICRFCKSSKDLEKLKKHEHKIAQTKLPMSVNENHVFCSKCRMKIHEYLLKSIEKHKQRKFASLSQSNTMPTATSVLTSSYSQSIEHSQESSTTSSSSKRPRRDTSSRNSALQKTPSSSSNRRVSVPVQSSTSTSDELPSSEIIRFSQVQVQPSSQSSSDVSSSQRPQQPLIPQVIVQAQPPEDSDDSSDDETQVPISSEVPGSAALSNVQPLIRRRRDQPEFPDDRQIPIYNRSNFGG